MQSDFTLFLTIQERGGWTLHIFNIGAEKISGLSEKVYGGTVSY